MLERRASVAGDCSAGMVNELDPPGYPVRPVPGDLDPWAATAVVVHFVLSSLPVEGKAQRAGRASPYRTDDLVHPAATGRNERLLV
jgi:hypothetical protein